VPASSSPVFVDTGAFAALADRNARHHREAKRLLQGSGASAAAW